jgi:hypothetical protein
MITTIRQWLERYRQYKLKIALEMARSQWRFVAAAFASFNTFLEFVGYFALALGIITTIAAFFGAALTPIGLVVIVGIAAVAFTVLIAYRFKQHLTTAATIRSLPDKIRQLETENESLAEKLKEVKRKIAVLESEVSGADKDEIYRDLAKTTETTDTRIAEERSLERSFFAKLFAKLYDLYVRIIELWDKIFEIKIVSDTLRTVIAVFGVFAGVFGVDAAKSGGLVAFTILTGLSGPVGIALVVMISLWFLFARFSSNLFTGALQDCEKDLKDKESELIKTIATARREILLAEFKKTKLELAKSKASISVSGCDCGEEVAPPFHWGVARL